MSYTRRDLVRDAAVVSLGGALGYGLSSIKGCHLNPTDSRPPSFALGVRIFFVGSWIFCEHSTSGDRILAVTLAPAGIPHWFPFGKWDPNRKWNKDSTPQLREWKSGSPVPSVSFSTGCASPKDLDTLATAAHKYTPISYLSSKNTNNQNYIPFTLNLGTNGLRVVSVPRPTNIIPAGVSFEMRLVDPNENCEKAPSTCQSSGISTTQIFEYVGATGMTFSEDSASPIMAATTSDADYQFRTLPSGAPTSAQDMAMFSALTGLIANFPTGGLSLASTGLTAEPLPGTDVPQSVDPRELGMQLDHPKLPSDPAICGGGSIFLGHR